MKNATKLITSIQEHIDKRSANSSAERMFAEFQFLCKLHRDFEKYLEDTKLKYNLNKMRRNKRLKEKRKLFCEWYINTNKSKQYKEILIELSEMVFVSQRTVELDILTKLSI